MTTTILSFAPVAALALSALMLAIVAETVFRGARRCELSQRVAGAFAALLGSVGCVLAAIYAPHLAAPLSLLAVGIFASVMTRIGRRVSGLNEFGITTATAVLDGPLYSPQKKKGTTT